MKTPVKRKQGAALIVVILSMTAAAMVGAAVISMATSMRYERVNLGIATRAYYLAESGASYVRACREADRSALPYGTFTFANGDQFQVSTSTNSAGVVMVQSTGIVNPGTHLESRRALVFNITHRVDPRTLDLGFDNDGDGMLDEEWQFTAEGTGSTGIPQMDTPPEGGDALEMDSWMGNFQLNWNSNPDLNLVAAWSNNQKRMSYDVQAKVSPAKYDGYPDDPVFNAALLVGIGFRLQPDKLSSYGASFYRMDPRFARNAPWTNDLGTAFLTTLRNTNLYLTLWSRLYPGKREIIAYKKLPSYMLHRSPMQRGEYDIKPFSTILIHIKEEFVGLTTNRVNKISLYMQSTNTYARWPDEVQNYTYAQWQDNTNIFPAVVTWDFPAGATVITNALFTTSRFNVVKPPEISLHVYDFAIKFFDDFVMRVEGYINPALPGSQIQY